MGRCYIVLVINIMHVTIQFSVYSFGTLSKLSPPKNYEELTKNQRRINEESTKNLRRTYEELRRKEFYNYKTYFTLLHTYTTYQNLRMENRRS